MTVESGGESEEEVCEDELELDDRVPGGDEGREES